MLAALPLTILFYFVLYLTLKLIQLLMAILLLLLDTRIIYGYTFNQNTSSIIYSFHYY